MSWVIQYIGQPWVAGKTDCWSFARLIWKEQYGLDIPVIDVDPVKRLDATRAFTNHTERHNWHLVHKPINGDAVLMGKNKFPSHVGIWQDERILHSVEGVGVIYSRPNDLAFQGLKVLGFYRRNELCKHTA